MPFIWCVILSTSIVTMSISPMFYIRVTWRHTGHQVNTPDCAIINYVIAHYKVAQLNTSAEESGLRTPGYVM